MKKVLKKIGLIIIVGLSFASCDSSSDSVTPTVVPSTFEFLFVKAPNAATGNSGLWNLKKETTIGTTFTGPTTLRTDDFATVASTIASTTLMTNQCSAYDKISKRYVVSSGERIIVYNFNTVSGSPALEYQFPVSNVQAMEFVNGRFFAIKNNKINEYNLTSTTPTTPLTSSFTEITLTSGQVSNLTQKGNYMSVIAGGNLYIIDVTGAGSVLPSYPQYLGTTDKYEGLEAINSAGSQFDLYVVKRNGVTNEFLQIDLSSTLTFSSSSLSTKYTLSFTDDPSSKISSALDYTTEFYYINSSNGATSDSNSVTAIDLTPTNSSTYVPTTVSNPGNHYAFGLQLKD
jgi:hypothetical protein